jgi:hypothetical protein
MSLRDLSDPDRLARAILRRQLDHRNTSVFRLGGNLHSRPTIWGYDKEFFAARQATSSSWEPRCGFTVWIAPPRFPAQAALYDNFVSKQLQIHTSRKW